MNYEEMIQTECTDERYEAWTDYRNALTEYILNGIGHYYRKEKLQAIGARRLPTNVSLEQLLAELDAKPVLAIWGAGGGNDIDLPRLAKNFHLVLIDHNLDQLKRTCNRFGLSNKDCTCVDLQFWDISDDDYKMIEAMLKDGLADEELIAYINEIVMRMQNHEYVKLPKFDFSVCVGLTSQLNARLGMLLTIHGRSGILADYLRELNDIAVSKLADTISVMTKHAIMYGYEVMSLTNADTLLSDLLTYDPEEWTNKDTWPPHDLTTDISGNDVLSDWICESLKDGILTPQNYETLVWPFAFSHKYVMLLCIFQKTT